MDGESGSVEALTCRELAELVTDYLEGALPLPNRGRFEEHVAGCRACTIYLAQMRETLRLVGNVTEESLSADACEALMAAFRGWRQ